MKIKRIWLVVSLFALAAGFMHAQIAKTLLKKAGIQKGNCLVIDENEKLALDLARESKLRIYLVNPEQKKVDAMRLEIDKAGKYGRITCRHENPENILYPAYFFDLVVVNLTKLDEGTFAEAYRLIKPGRIGVFMGGQDIDSLLKKLDAPCVKATKAEKAVNFTIVKKGYEHTNRYLKPPLTRLWVTCATQKQRLRQYNRGIVEVVKGPDGEVVRDDCMGKAPLDAYTGLLLKPEDKYRKSDFEVEPAPHRYDGVRDASLSSFMRHHGRLDARELKTGRLAWTFFADFLFCGCCSNPYYANNVLYKITYRSLLAIDAQNGNLLWQHRNGGDACSSPLAARSVLYLPNKSAFRIQAFVSDPGWQSRIPKGDVLTKGSTSPNPSPLAPNPSLDWPMFHYDACRTGNSPDKTIKPPLKLLWKFDTGGRVRSSAAIVDDIVYIGSGSNKFYAIDAKTGMVKWRFFTDDDIHSSPCVYGGCVYFGCDDGRIYALDKKNGQLLWAYQTATKAPPTPLYGACLAEAGIKEWHETLKASPGMQLAFSPHRSFSPLCFNGQPLRSPGAVRSSPVVANGILHAGSGLGEDADPCWGFLYALDAATGRLIWKKGEDDIGEKGELPFGVAISPCLHDGLVHFSYGSYTVVDAKNGGLILKGGRLLENQRFMRQEKLPSFYIGPDGKRIDYTAWPIYFTHTGGCCTVRGDIAVDTGKQMALLTTGAFLLAVDLRTGEVKWEGGNRSTIDWGLFRSTGGSWSGKEKLRGMGNANFHQPVALLNGKAYMGGDKGLAVFDLEKGGKHLPQGKLYRGDKYSKARRPPWVSRIYDPLAELTGPTGFVNTAPAIANGHIFAGADDGCVYAWDLNTEEMIWKHETGGKVRSSPAISRGRLYIGSDDGYVYCFSNK